MNQKIQAIVKKLYHENAEQVKQAIEEIGRVGKGNREAMKALQAFLGKEQRMPLRILSAKTISKFA